MGRFFPPKGELNEISQMESIQVMGHEISGEVIAIGDDVTNVKVGDKVVVEVTGTCLDRHRYQDPKMAICLNQIVKLCFG